MGDAAAPSMRDKNLLQLFLGLNVALAACLVVYLFLSSNRAPAITTTSFANYSAKSNRTSVPVLTADRATPATNGLVAGTNNAAAASASNAAATASVIGTSTNAAGTTNDPTAALTSAGSAKRVGWEEIEADTRNNTDHYKGYLNSLRAVGCPEDKVRYIALADINELFGKKRLKEAVTYDL